MKLQALKRFNEYGIYANAGEVKDFSDALGLYLRDSFPACWEVYVEPVVAPIVAAIEAPPVDKMIRKPKAKK